MLWGNYFHEQTLLVAFIIDDSVDASSLLAIAKPRVATDEIELSPPTATGNTNDSTVYLSQSHA